MKPSKAHQTPYAPNEQGSSRTLSRPVQMAFPGFEKPPKLAKVKPIWLRKATENLERHRHLARKVSVSR